MRKIVLSLLAITFAGIVIFVSVLLYRVPVTLGVLANAMFGSSIETPESTTLQERLQLPPGFTLGLYASDIPGVRFMTFSRAGDLIVARPRHSKIMLLRDTNGDGTADTTDVLLDNLTRPHSTDFHGDWLYIAESNAIGRIKFDHEQGKTVGSYEQLITGLGDEGNHWSKTIRFGPDGMLYLSAGSTCNVCLEDDDMRATITRYQPDGSGEERVATGLRNSVGMDWAPFDQQLYATDNGRDLLGDDYPPCELNKIESGGFYGWPHINGFGDLDPDFGDATRLPEAISPVHGFRAHNAPLGIRFITMNWPDQYKNAALVALHGSWNRSTYDGYKVVSLHPFEGHLEGNVEGNNNAHFEERDFLTGFELDGDLIGRPVDIAQGPDDCAYISDDYASAIYRVCYGEAQTAAEYAPASITATGLEDIDPTRLATLKDTGRQLYITRGCVACHTLSSEDAPHGLKLLQNIAGRYSVESLAEFYRTPTAPMPPVVFTSEHELAMSAYLLGL